MTLDIQHFYHHRVAVSPRDAGRRHRKDRDGGRRASLDALHPMPLLPSRQFNRRSRAVGTLRRVEFVEVSKSEQRMGKMWYTIDVYYRDAGSRIPVHGPFGRGVRLQQQSVEEKKRRFEPSVQVEHAFEDFLHLRHESYLLARAGHILDACAFCHAVICFNSHSAVKPKWNSHWFKSEESVCEMLTQYLSELLRFAQLVPASGPEHCDGQERIPRLLSQFLRSSERVRRSR